MHNNTYFDKKWLKICQQPSFFLIIENILYMKTQQIGVFVYVGTKIALYIIALKGEEPGDVSTNTRHKKKANMGQAL